MNSKEDELRRRVLSRLIFEHQTICRLYHLPLATPVFEISKGQGRAGCWSGRFGTLSLAAWLIEKHDWEVVIEVLKHEICHQYVSFAGHREPPHGPAFQEACERLGVLPEFRRSQGEIPRLLGLRAGGTSHPVLQRVEKLFALATSANEHEAALAMQKANALLKRHNLERLRGAVASEFDFLILPVSGERISAQMRTIIGLLKDFFFVEAVISRRFSARDGQEHRVVELTGARENLAVAEYVHHFLVDRLDALWCSYKKEGRVAGRMKNSYQLGVLKGFAEKLGEEDRKPSSAGVGSGASSLICAADPGLIRYFKARYPRLRTIRPAGPRLYRDSYEAGQEEGKRLVIHKGVTDNDGNRGGLLSGS